MAITAIVHLVGEEAFLADLDEVPDPTHTFIMMRNLRMKDGKPLSYVNDAATAVLYAWSRITFLELMGDISSAAGSSVNGSQGTSILAFFRENS